MAGLLTKLFGSHSERQFKPYWPIVEQIRSLESEMKQKNKL